MHPHDLLANVIANLALSVSTTESPVAENGLLKKDFGYCFEIKKVKEEFETIFGKGFRPSDGFLSNVIKKNSITVECKSYVDENDGNFVEQLIFYGTNTKFKDVFLPQGFNNEILVVCNDEPQLIQKIQANIRVVQNHQGFNTNIVLWVVEKEDAQGNHKVKKIQGTHIHDAELETRMTQQGFLAKPLRTILFYTPQTQENVLVAEMTKRLLSFQATQIEKECELKEFIDRQKNDTVLPDKKMETIVKTAFKLFPEIGEIANAKIFFKKSIRFGNVQKKIMSLSDMTKAEYQQLLREDGNIKKKRKQPDPNQRDLNVFFTTA